MLPPERLLVDHNLDLGDAGKQAFEAPDEAPNRQVRLESLVREWLLDLQGLGRSRTTIDCCSRRSYMMPSLIEVER